MLGYLRVNDLYNEADLQRAGNLLAPIQIAHNARITSVLALPGNRRFLSVGNTAHHGNGEVHSEIRCWELNDNHQMVHLFTWAYPENINAYPINAIMLLANGLVVSADNQGMLMIWRIQDNGNGQVLSHTNAGLGRPVNVITVLPNQRILCGSESGRIGCFSLTQDQQLQRLFLWMAHDNYPVTALNVLPNGQVLSGGNDHRIRCWIITDEREVLHAIAIDEAEYCIALGSLPNGAIFSIHEDNDDNVIFWQLNPGAIQRIATHHEDNVSSWSILPNGDGFLLGTYSVNAVSIVLYRVLPDGNRIVNDLWQNPIGHEGERITSVRMLPNGLILAGNQSGRLSCFYGIAPQYCFNAGLDAIQQGNYEFGISQYRLSTACQYSKALINLGNLYINGIGVEANVNEAQQLYIQATNVNANDSFAFINLGLLSMTRIFPANYEAASVYFQRAQTNGNEYVATTCYLGLLYQYGLGGQPIALPPQAQALVNYQHAAELGHYRLAQILYGIFRYLTGTQLHINLANDYFQRAINSEPRYLRSLDENQLYTESYAEIITFFKI